MSVLKGLQNLLIKMGGTPASGDNTDETVRKIAEAYNPSSGGGGVLVVHVERTATEESETYTLDKTWQELANALNSGKSLSFVGWDANENIGISYSWSISNLSVYLNDGNGQLDLETDSPDGYPTVTIEF